MLVIPRVCVHTINIVLMNMKILLAAVAALSVSLVAKAHDCHIAQNSVGDWSVVSLGGFTLVKPISIDLAPTNVVVADAVYSIRCQVIYIDGAVDRPETEEELAAVRKTGERLNEWLREFVAERFVGMRHNALLMVYYQKTLAESINTVFPRFVAEKIGAMDSGERLDVDMVTVTVEAEGMLKKELVDLYELDAEE